MPIVNSDNGDFINIIGNHAPQQSAAITLQIANKIIWRGTVIYFAKRNAFQAKTNFLASNYQIATNFFPSIHAISFDLETPT